MRLERLNIVNYRNIKTAEIELTGGINCFVGENGAGKTNVLDSIYYLSFCKSYTGLQDSLNICHDEPFFVIQGSYVKGGGGREEIYCGFKRGSKKQFKRNKKEYTKLAEHIGLLPLVIVSPRDEDLISDSPETRRRYVDSVISQCDPAYLDTLMSYNRLLIQRNALLKQMDESGSQDFTLMDILDRQIGAMGGQIAEKRRVFVTWLRPAIETYYAKLSSEREEVDVTYVTGLDRYELYQGLVDSRRRDLALGYTSRGVHKDDIEFSMGGHPMKRVGSQGQRKSFVIALKLAQYQYLTEQKGERPLLLLDDMFDKLDGRRGENLVNLVASDSFDQIFITDTAIERLQSVLSKTSKDHRIFGVTDGEIEVK